MDYSHMSFADIRKLRDQYPDDSPMQAQLAPYEHQAFAREWTQDNPMVAAPALAVSEMLGKNAARAAPMWALAALSCCSATKMSGRWASTARP